MRLIIAALLCTATAQAQQPTFTLASSADDLTRAWVEHATATKTAHPEQNYTYLILHRDLNYIHGQLTADNTQKSEQIFIGGLPYIRRLERNGKPLTGKDLQRETDLYDKTVRERTGLTESLRDKLSYAKVFSTTNIPVEHVQDDFRHEIVAREVIDGHECLVLEFTLLHADAPPTLQRHIRLSIDTENLNVLHAWVQWLAEDNTVGKGSISDIHFVYIDGVLLPSRSVFDTTIQQNPRDILAFNTYSALGVKALLHKHQKVGLHIIGSDDFSNYRRFNASVTISPTDIPPPADPASPR